MGVFDANSRGHAEVWESIMPTQEATLKHGRRSLQHKGATLKRKSA